MNLKRSNRQIDWFLIIMAIFSFSIVHTYGSDQVVSDTINKPESKFTRKAIYDFDKIEHGIFYNKFWGLHYRNMYFTPILVPSVNLAEINGGLSLVKQVPQIYGLLMEDKSNYLHLIRVLGHSSTFTHSNFFKDIYKDEDIKDTYVDNFVGDAYTITNPYSFIIVDRLAKDLRLPAFDPKVYYLPPGNSNVKDTIADGSNIGGKLIAIYDLSKYSGNTKLLTTNHVLAQIQTSKSVFVDQQAYIRERLLDILVGDWNKVPENWLWHEEKIENKTIYTPIVIERTHAFTKVDGIFLKTMLNVLNLGSISNYGAEFDDLKKSNAFGLALDATLSDRSNKEDWIEQAKYIQATLTGEKIDEAFNLLPSEVRSDSAFYKIRNDLELRKKMLVQAASKYYDILQETPVVTGTLSDDRFEIQQLKRDSLLVNVYDKKTDSLLYQKGFNKKSKELWIYGLDGNDSYTIKGDRKKTIPITLIGGQGENNYNIENGKNVTVYDYKDHNTHQDSLSTARVILTDINGVHSFDYQKRSYSDWDFTPMGIFDSDLGISIGAYLTYTRYGFKRSPYTYKHMFGYNYIEGLSYVGFFPSLNERLNLVVQASSTTPNNFYNFFGFGNNTPSYKGQKNKYNQVKVDKYDVSGSLYWKLKGDHQLIGSSSLQLFRLKNKYNTERLINEYYSSDDAVFKNNLFWNLDLSYEITHKINRVVPFTKLTSTLGWVLNLTSVDRSFPHWQGSASADIKLSHRITLATQLNGNVLFTNKYEFYQAATIDLRGYRTNRFIGKQSFYQYTDLRYDLGRLENPFTPILYGVFIGFDYGRVWHPEEDSKLWHTSLGGGLWLTFFKKYTGKFTYFRSKDGGRFYIGLGLGF